MDRDDGTRLASLRAALTGGSRAFRRRLEMSGKRQGRARTRGQRGSCWITTACSHFRKPRMKGSDMTTEMNPSKSAGMTKSTDHFSGASIGSQANSGRPYLYVVGGNGTAVIDPSNWHVVFVAPRVAPKTGERVFDNHYLDQVSRVCKTFPRRPRTVLPRPASTSRTQRPSATPRPFLLVRMLSTPRVSRRMGCLRSYPFPRRTSSTSTTRTPSRRSPR